SVVAMVMIATSDALIATADASNYRSRVGRHGTYAVAFPESSAQILGANRQPEQAKLLKGHSAVTRLMRIIELATSRSSMEGSTVDVRLQSGIRTLSLKTNIH